ncbi:MAG: leucine-rich repeat protein, partial [Rikenellaceae bacterium]
GLKAAIAAANAEGVSRSPEVIFTALQIVPANAFDCTSTGDATYKANSFSVSLPVATQIGGSAFYTAEGLTSIYTPEVTTVGENALRQCILLTEIDLPMATTVGSTAFRRNDKMTSLKLPILTALGNNVIRDCEALESVSFPEVTTLGTYVFQDCDNLKTVDLPKATVIGQYSFCTCPLLTSLILGTEGTGVTSINAGAFNKFDYSAVVEDGYVGCTLSIKVADSANFTINSDSGVLTIDSSTAVTFESIVEVEGEAPVVPDNYDCSLSDFDGSFSLETMGNTWTIDDESAVAADFDNLELSIAAANSAGVTPKLIFKKLDTMPESAFYSGSNSANNNLGFTIELTSATTISAQAFWRCNLLTAIDADEVKYIGASAFRNSGITTLELPELVSSASTTTTLAGQTFRGGSFQSIILPKVTALGANEFNACANLTYLELGTDVDCSGFTTFSLNTNENSSLYNITSIGSMTLKIKVGEGANFTISDNVLTVNGDEIYTFANIEVVVE